MYHDRSLTFSSKREPKRNVGSGFERACDPSLVVLSLAAMMMQDLDHRFIWRPQVDYPSSPTTPTTPPTAAPATLSTHPLPLPNPHSHHHHTHHHHPIINAAPAPTAAIDASPPPPPPPPQQQNQSTASSPSSPSSPPFEDEPLYVNSKQYTRIIKRRIARARLEEIHRMSKQRKVRVCVCISLSSRPPQIFFFSNCSFYFNDKSHICMNRDTSTPCVDPAAQGADS
jgi:hypothetical protein